MTPETVIAWLLLYCRYRAAVFTIPISTSLIPAIHFTAGSGYIVCLCLQRAKRVKTSLTRGLTFDGRVLYGRPRMELNGGRSTANIMWVAADTTGRMTADFSSGEIKPAKSQEKAKDVREIS